MATRLAWSCCNLQHLDLPLLKAALQLMQQAAAHSTPQGPTSSSSSSSIRGLMSPQELGCWYEVVRTVTDAAAVNQEMVLALQVPPQLALHMQNAWVSQQGPAHLTEFQQQVLTTFKTMGESCYALVPTRDGQCVVDVLLGAKMKQKNVAVLLEVPARFTANAPHLPLGPTVARWNALLRRGCQVRRHGPANCGAWAADLHICRPMDGAGALCCAGQPQTAQQQGFVNCPSTTNQDQL
jgi:hypothetical protein